ncbi:hypothetical protein LUCX_329 [Xanthomonas phage vB_XciM_LucasX]|nr:hypothetical protein LUCX_329 [Xanthomonas phage vB_XciM_LucasX]
MSFKTEESVIYVELDALMDTRLPTLGLISSQAAVEASTDPRYFERVIDDFEPICGISKDTFRTLYAKRDTEILKASVITEMVFILDGIVRQLEEEARSTPFISRVRVEVNYYPYVLDEGEREMIATAIMARCGVETLVELIRLDPSVITPTRCRDRYSGMILYNFHDWMKHHLKAFESVKMPRVTVVAPALYYDVVPASDAFVEDGLSEHITAFELARVGMVEMFALDLLPAANFSMARVPGQYTSKPKPEVPVIEVAPRQAPRQREIK